jgi:1,4-dihydroxy-2-naphthoyl-CoA synthase
MTRPYERIRVARGRGVETIALATDDAREGLKAFLEKRRPRWREA